MTTYTIRFPDPATNGLSVSVSMALHRMWNILSVEPDGTITMSPRGDGAGDGDAVADVTRAFTGLACSWTLSTPEPAYLGGGARVLAGRTATLSLEQRVEALTGALSDLVGDHCESHATPEPGCPTCHALTLLGRA